MMELNEDNREDGRNKTGEEERRGEGKKNEGRKTNEEEIKEKVLNKMKAFRGCKGLPIAGKSEDKVICLNPGPVASNIFFNIALHIKIIIIIIIYEKKEGRRSKKPERLGNVQMRQISQAAFLFRSSIKVHLILIVSLAS